MPSPERIEIYKQHRAAQEKYVYFLLAAVGAAIALTVNQTQGAKLAYSQLPLGVAVCLWGLSFFFGCKHLNRVESTLFANADLLKVKDGVYPSVGSDNERISVAEEVIRKIIESHSTWAARFARWQFGAFILGAVWYLAWHIFEMSLRS